MSGSPRILGPRDPLPHRPRRVTVAGASGSGKTTTARRVAAAIGAPHTETDALHHGPRWVPRPEFLDDVRTLIAGDGWVCEWQYRTARPLIVARADLMVWLDPPVAVQMWQVISRTVGRRLRREVLWNGNVEPPLHTLLTDPDHVVRWAWRSRRRMRSQVPETAAAHPGLVVVRLRSRREVEAWLAGPLREALSR